MKSPAEQRGTACYRVGDYDGAIAAFLEAKRQGQTTATIESGLGSAYMFTAQPREAIAAYRAALRLGGQGGGRWWGSWAPQVLANLIVLLDHQPETTLEHALENRKAWWQAFGQPLRATWKRHRNAPDPERSLRIGYVGGDFRRHSAASAFAPVVLRHAPGYEPVIYMTCADRDEVTQAFVEGAEFHQVDALPQAELAAQIRADGIDILVDLSGYTAFNRLETFCRRPAPIQVCGWGYATGTGLPVFDGFFCDEVVAPPALAQRGYREALLYLPCVVPFGLLSEPTASAPGPLPVLRAGRFTFGSFNRWNKVGPEVLEAWAEILAAVPGSRLLLKEPGIFEGELIHRRVSRAMAAHGVAPARVEWLPWAEHAEHLTAYDAVDLALDPFPHTGGITALEGLWHGVPPVTLLGERVPERLSASFCAVLDLKDFVATSREDYVARAVRFATEDHAALAEIRATLRGRMAASPLCIGYVQAVETHYRDLWRSWCQRQAAR